MKTKKELQEEIDRIDTALFYIDMKDRWDSVDYEESRRLSAKRHQLEKELLELDNGQ